MATIYKRKEREGKYQVKIRRKGKGLKIGIIGVSLLLDTAIKMEN